MHEPLLMDVGEAVGDLTGDVDRLVDRKVAAGHAVGQRFAFEMLHDEVIEASIVADVVDAADVRVLQTGDGFRLAIELLAHLGADASDGNHDLDRDRSIEAVIVCAIHLTHAARAEQFHDFVRPETGAGLERHSGGSIPATRRAASRNNSPIGCPAHVSANFS